MVPIKEFLNQRFAIGKNWPTRGLIYGWRFSNYKNFNSCCRRLGRKILINAEAFEQWLKEKTE